jgi:hypothetical protein
MLLLAVPALYSAVLHCASVDDVQVKTIIVTGHYNCGAVKAALQLPHTTPGLVNCWISDIRECRNQAEAELRGLDPEQQLARWVPECCAEQLPLPVMIAVCDSSYPGLQFAQLAVLCMNLVVPCCVQPLRLAWVTTARLHTCV